MSGIKFCVLIILFLIHQNYGISKSKENCTESAHNEWANEFHSCLIGKKYNDGGQDLENIVNRILTLSRNCIRETKKECQPKHNGFVIIVNKVIDQIKDYATMYLEEIHHGRNKIKDLKCVEIISSKNYEKCFKIALENPTPSNKEFEDEVENAIGCINEKNKLCSNEAKTFLNQIVRIIIGVKPKAENFKTEVKEANKEWRWYDYIIQPFISFWNMIKSFFG